MDGLSGSNNGCKVKASLYGEHSKNGARDRWILGFRFSRKTFLLLGVGLGGTWSANGEKGRVVAGPVVVAK